MSEFEDLIKIVQKESEQIRDISKSIAKIQKMKASNADLSDLNKELKKLTSSVQTANLNTETQAKIVALTTELNRFVQEEDLKRKSEFASRLQELAATNNVKLGGQLPMVRAGRYYLDVRENNSITVWWGPQQEVVTKCKYSAECAIKAISENESRLTKQPFDEKSFFQQLFSAYQMEIARTRKRIGDPASIGRVYLAFLINLQEKKFIASPKKENLSEYGRIEFANNLSRLSIRSLDGVEISLITATRSNTQNRADFIWMPMKDSNEGHTISDIVFKEVKA